MSMVQPPQDETTPPAAPQDEETIRRGVGRWVLLAAHVVPFVLALFTAPTHGLFDSHDGRLLLGGWALVLLAHLLLTALLDLREGFVQGRRLRRARRQREIQNRRARMLQNLYAKPDDA
ncbi:MAG: hypothetical protein EA396_11735 [Anaerolineaceae bacterium]|nr:MAG: hypothetical protein EA396_11735 [Anaerolineaceae bacterium]